MYNEKERLQKNNNAKDLLNVKNNNIQRSVKSVTEDVRVSYKNTNLVSYPVLQFETDEEKIKRIKNLCKRYGYDVSDKEAAEYLNQMKIGIHPRIQNHNAIIRPWGNYFRIEETTFGGTGMMGRIEKEGGAQAQIDNIDHGYQLPEGYIREETISSRSLRGIEPRRNLSSVMGGSAYDMTQIQNSEHLHSIAHSLGGQDEPQNLTPGYHALNTAMIPIENLVRNLATMGIEVEYKVQMHPRVGYNIWVSNATMTIGFYYNGNYYEHSWNISVDSEERLSQDSYNKIVQDIQKFKQTVGLTN